MAFDFGIVILTLVIGALIAVLVWSLTKKSSESSTKGKSEKAAGGKKDGKKSSGAQSKPAKKKPAVAISKDSKSTFTHSWLLTSLKGHTGAITDMDFSANGKHLATCAEDEVFVSQPMVETPTPSETDSGCVLSRRQKRNRMKKTQAGNKKKEHPTKTVENKQRMRRATPLKYYTRLQMKNSEIYSFLYQYVLLDDQLLNLGYPVESSFYPNRAIIYKTPEANVTYYRSDVKRAFRHQPEIIEMAEHLSYSSEHSDPYEEKPPLSPSLEKRCVRCKKGFFVTLDGEYLTEERCTYHWGQWKRPCSPGESHGYTCCPGHEGSIGCTSGDLHVWNGVSPGMNGPFTDYVRTTPGIGPKCHSIYALDCEMCYTGRGLEVCKVSVISIDGCLVYEALVKPHHRVIDYNTRFSGLCEQDLKKATKTISDVQRDLLGFIYSQTILIGHGLENDLRALRILHSVIIDTAVLFPHYFGFPFRRSLKSLVATYLQRHIQVGHNGHDSFEDARACAELVLWKAACQLRPRHRSEHMP